MSQTKFDMTPEIVGPYSHWPRQRRRGWKKPVAYSSSVVAAAVFVHCAVPMML